MLRSMTDNPLYDTSNTNVIYDIIPDITSLSKPTAGHAQRKTTTTGPQLPPCVPPPRSGGAAASIPGLALPKIPIGGEKEDYVQMGSPLTPLSAVSPRYTEPPSLTDQPSQRCDNAAACAAHECKKSRDKKDESSASSVQYETMH